MRGEARIGPVAAIDDGVVLGYASGRGPTEPLELGAGAVLRSGTVLYAGSRIGLRLHTGHHVVIREECELGDDVAVWSNSVIDYGCVVGHGAKIHVGCYVAQYSTIGDGAFLAPGVRFANDLYPGDPASSALMGGPTIGARAQLGVNVSVLPYVHVGAGAIIGAGSVVTRDIPPGTVALGAPARPVRAVEDLPELVRRLPGRRRP